VPLLIDTDMGLDDARVIVSLPMQDRFHIVGVVTVEGSAGAAKGADNVLRLLEALGVRSVPVVVGATQAINGPIPTPAWRAMCEGLGGVTLPAAQRAPESTDAVAFISERLRASKEPVRILAIGPLANLALVLTADATLAQKIHSVSLLGDFLACTGYNCSTDVDAAKVVFDSGIPISMVVPSATDKAPFNATFLGQVQALTGPAAKLVARFMAGHSDGSMKLWDDSVLAGLLDPTVLTSQTVKAGTTKAVDLDVTKLHTLLLALWGASSPVMP